MRFITYAAERDKKRDLGIFLVTKEYHIEEMKEERDEDSEEVKEEMEKEEEKEEKKKAKEEGLTFFNISTNPPKISHLDEELGQTSFLMSGCEFVSVWDVYDGGIVPSLNSPSSSLAASNTSFVRCYRSQNVAVNGSEGNPSKPARQNQTDNGANSFTWCVWNGSKTTGSGTSYSDGASNGGAIYMYSKTSGTLSVKFCSFNDCYAHYDGGGIMCRSISSINIENNSFNTCTAQNYGGGGMYTYSISSCVRISGCEFQKCKASGYGKMFFC
ncbi:uncharacterized protein MONOS_8708 [Monocercomonoides exilis]|uniref:uncharacterized protein n=1 Tax=Monocercomonoides exilis TaxID=2049356 RepID=UPI00355A72BC|nr:hypothetical protein MONOS_8708 [Monocercomonoides exilis]|eukprot:MONOS_8708.1-p1 / transcript=MONOS_8708.1 / gene=MONOS_8708 / organism=Monocercomonoides_exilis_PA203 / gene_product=unspecified product / transcript_product=unspecified product / location=Mono_scaffold00335:44883-45790(-) / protein_length=271 / sequence_SO=supercontig / SO=protein_coding / is_pseudo=false